MKTIIESLAPASPARPGEAAVFLLLVLSLMASIASALSPVVWELAGWGEGAAVTLMRGMVMLNGG